MSKLPVLLIFTFLITHHDAVKILAVFPVPSVSHQIVFGSLTEELARRGHEVTVITTNPGFPKGEAPLNLREIDVHDLSYKKWRTLSKPSRRTDMPDSFKTALHKLNEIFEAQLNVKEVQKLLKEEKFDVLLLEAVVRSTLILSHVFKVPVIQVSSFGSFPFNIETVGAAWHPLLYPNIMSQRLYNRSKWEKIVELWYFYRLNYEVQYEVEQAENQMAKRLFGPDVPPISELKNNVDMLFLNIRPIWEENRPVPPNVIYMGGLHVKPAKELPEDLKTYLDSSKNGVVYMSLGTHIQTTMLPPEKVQIIVNVFSKLPYDVLLKWDKDELPGRTDNIKISKWLPQSDLLRHPKIKVFITQAGLQSTDEAIIAGVPLIAIPMISDQWLNAEKYVHYKIGVQLKIATLNEEEFRNTINNVINDDSYRKNIEAFRDRVSDEPMSPMDRAIWWIEHVVRHGGAKHLRPPSANMSWAEYLELELVLIVLAVVLGSLSVLLTLLYQLWRLFFGKSKNISKKFKKN